MRISHSIVVLSIASLSYVAHGFTPSPSFGIAQGAKLRMSEVALSEETETETAAEDAGPQPVPSGLTVKFVKKSIDNLTAENFSESLDTIAPYLINDAGQTFYNKCLRRIAVKAKFLGVEIPEGYVQEAFCTAKRRAKQDAFIKVKEEERLAAEAEAAEAAAAEEGEEAA